MQSVNIFWCPETNEEYCHYDNVIQSQSKKFLDIIIDSLQLVS